MSGCDRMRHSLGPYVLGALDIQEAAEVQRHIRICPECAAEHEAMAPLPELLTLAGGAQEATAEPLSAAFEERLLDAYARDHTAPSPRRRGWLRRRSRTRLRWMAAGAGLAALAASAVIAVALVAGGGDPEPQYNLALKSTGTVPGAHAYGTLEAESGGTELHLWVRGMPGDTHAVYEVLCEAPGLRASAGTFRVNAKGRAYVILNTAARRGEYDSIRVVRRVRDPGGDVVTSDVLATKLS